MMGARRSVFEMNETRNEGRGDGMIVGDVVETKRELGHLADHEKENEAVESLDDRDQGRSRLPEPEPEPGPGHGHGRGLADISIHGTTNDERKRPGLTGTIDEVERGIAKGIVDEIGIASEAKTGIANREVGAAVRVIASHDIPTRARRVPSPTPHLSSTTIRLRTHLNKITNYPTRHQLVQSVLLLLHVLVVVAHSQTPSLASPQWMRGSTHQLPLLPHWSILV